jgi:5-formyltetrahydrofolate cyclo-ligase
MLKKRDEVSHLQHSHASLKAVQEIQANPMYQNASVVGLYHPIKNELNILSLKEDSKTFLLPVVEDNQMHYRLFHKDTQLIQSTLHILEPKENPIMEERLDLIIVPALAVTKYGQRIGYGKGFFDQFIQKNPHIHTLTVVFDFQVLEDIPTDPHDQNIQDLIIIKGDSYDY